MKAYALEITCACPRRKKGKPDAINFHLKNYLPVPQQNDPGASKTWKCKNIVFKNLIIKITVFYNLKSSFRKKDY